MGIFKWILVIVLPAVLWAGIALLLAFEGSWMQPVVERGDTHAFEQYATTRLQQDFNGNASLVLLKNGQVFANHSAKSTHVVGTIDQKTLFPLASMSKFVAAIALHKLALQGHIDLQQPVSQYLKSWQLPPGDFDQSKITVSSLLSHTSGLTDGLGFGDYRADETIPSLVQSLNNPRAGTGSKVIAQGIGAGEQFNYSGGGYLILELLVQDVTGMPYQQWVQQNVFAPLNMQRASFGYLAAKQNHAGSLDVTGQPSEVFQYASAAATGLSASSEDLARLVLALLNDNDFTQDKLLSDELTHPLAESFGQYIWGAGAMLYAPTAQNTFVYGHDGSNDPAINTSLRINPETGDAIILLLTGDRRLASDIASEWTFWQTGTPDFLQVDKVVASAFVPVLAGVLFWLLLLLGYWFRTRQAKQHSDEALLID